MAQDDTDLEWAPAPQWRTPPERWLSPVDSGADWSDYEAIRTIIAGYCHVTDRAMNQGSTPDLASYFADDATFQNSFQVGQRWVGQEAVVAWWREFLSRRAGYYRWIRHKIYEPLITIDADTALSAVHFDADSVGRDDRIRTMSGIYDDLLVKRGGRWVIKDRYITIHYVHESGEAKPFAGWKPR